MVIGINQVVFGAKCTYCKSYDIGDLVVAFEQIGHMPTSYDDPWEDGRDDKPSYRWLPACRSDDGDINSSADANCYDRYIDGLHNFERWIPQSVCSENHYRR